MRSSGSLTEAKREPSISGRDSITLLKRASIFNFRRGNSFKLDVKKANEIISNVNKPKYLPPIPVELALIVKFCLEYLVKHKLHKNELFQLQGKFHEQKKLLQSIKNGDLPTKLSGYSSRSISFVIRELMENHYAPLFPYEEFDWMEEQVDSKDKFIENAVRCMNTKIVPERYALLESLLLLLYKINLKQDHTDDPEWIPTGEVIGSILARPAEDELDETQEIRRKIGNLLIENVPMLLKRKSHTSSAPHEPSPPSPTSTQNGSFNSKQKPKQTTDGTFANSSPTSNSNSNSPTNMQRIFFKRRPQLPSSKAATLLKLMRFLVDSPHPKAGLFIQKSLREEEEMNSLKKLLSSRADPAFLPLDCYSIHTIAQYILQTLCHESEPLLGYHAMEDLLNGRHVRVALTDVFSSIREVHQRLLMLLFQCIDQSMSSSNGRLSTEDASRLKEILFPCFFFSMDEEQVEKKADYETRQQLMNDLFKYGKEIIVQVLEEQEFQLYTRSTSKSSINSISSGGSMSSLHGNSEFVEQEGTQEKEQEVWQVGTFFSVAVIVFWAIKCHKKAAKKTTPMMPIRNAISPSIVQALTSKNRQSVVTSSTTSVNSTPTDSVKLRNNSSSSMDPTAASLFKTGFPPPLPSSLPSSSSIAQNNSVTKVTESSSQISSSDHANKADKIVAPVFPCHREVDEFSSNVLCEMIDFLFQSKPDSSLYFESKKKFSQKKEEEEEEQNVLMDHFERGEKTHEYEFFSSCSIAAFIKRILSQKFEPVVPFEMVRLYLSHHQLHTRHHSGTTFWKSFGHRLGGSRQKRGSESDGTLESTIRNSRHDLKVAPIIINLWKLEAFLLKELPRHKRRLLQLVLSHLDHITKHEDSDDIVQQVYEEMLPILFAPVSSTVEQSDIDFNIQIQIYEDMIISNIFHQDRATTNVPTLKDTTVMQPTNTRVDHLTDKTSRETKQWTQATEPLSQKAQVKPARVPLALPYLKDISLSDLPMTLTDWANSSHLTHKIMQKCMVPAPIFYQWVQDMKQDVSESSSQQDIIEGLLQLCASKEFQQSAQYYAMIDLYEFLYDCFLAYCSSSTVSGTSVMTGRSFQAFCDDCFLLKEYNDWMIQVDTKKHSPEEVIHFGRFLLFLLRPQHVEPECLILRHVYPFSQRNSQVTKETLVTSVQLEPCLLEMAQTHGANIYQVCSSILSDQGSSMDSQASKWSLLLQPFDDIHAKDVAILQIAGHLRLVPDLISVSKVKEVSLQVFSSAKNQGKSLSLIEVLEVFNHLTREILSHEQVAYLFPTMEQKLQVLFHVWGLADPSII